MRQRGEGGATLPGSPNLDHLIEHRLRVRGMCRVEHRADVIIGGNARPARLFREAFAANFVIAALEEDRLATIASVGDAMRRPVSTMRAR